MLNVTFPFKTNKITWEVIFVFTDDLFFNPCGESMRVLYYSGQGVEMLNIFIGRIFCQDGDKSVLESKFTAFKIVPRHFRVNKFTAIRIVPSYFG